MVVEAAVIAPALVGLLLLVVFAGRVAEADTRVRHAAAVAARAASTHAEPDGAAEAARAAAAANLAASGLACARLDATVDTAAFHPGGAVVVTLTCTASLHDLAMLAVPGQRTFSAKAAEVVDRFRSSGEHR